MTKYEWKQEEILENIKNTTKQETLLKEINDQRDDVLHKMYDRECTPKEFRRSFRNDFIKLAKIDEDMLTYTIRLHEMEDVGNIYKYGFFENGMTTDELVTIVHDFYHSLGDKDIAKEVDIILNPDNHFLRIEQGHTKEINSILQGRAIKDENSNLTYGSYYRRNNIQDIPTLTHEVGHMLSHRLFQQDANPITQLFLSELESQYMELLSIQYIANNLKDPKMALCLQMNRLNYIFDQAWDVFAQYLLFESHGFSTGLADKLKEAGYTLKVNDETIKLFQKMPLLKKAKIINSFMAALELYRITQEDQQKGIKLYKKIFTSKETEYKKFLDKHKINYIKDTSTLECMLDKARQLKKIVSDYN